MVAKLCRLVFPNIIQVLLTGELQDALVIKTFASEEQTCDTDSNYSLSLFLFLSLTMAMWLRVFHFLSELLTFATIRIYDTVKYLWHQGFRDGRRRLPPIRSEFLSYSATKLARMIREKKLTSEQLVNAVIARIREVDPLLHAVVEDRFEAALDDARQADKELAACTDVEELANKKPFLGVPFTVKDSISVQGMLATCGSKTRRGVRAKKNAVCVARMLTAGGIPLAISNVPEMCLWVENGNHLYGRTNNPYDLHRTPGGSSGGEGALVGACASVWGVGTDIAGSVRLPSAWCGIFGHKLTPGCLTREGVLPATGQEIKSLIGIIGPMARSTEDLVAMLKIMVDDPAALRLDEPVELRELKYYFCDNEGASYISAIQPEVRLQVHRVVNFIKNDLNAEIKPFPDAEQMIRGSYYWLAQFAAYGAPPLKFSFDEHGNAWDPIMELIKHAGGFSERTIPGITISLLDEMYRNNPDKCRTDLEQFEEFKKRIYDLLKNDGILVLPSSLSVAPFHHGTLCHPALYLGLAGLINILKLPSTVVPMGLSSRGIPLSVQIIAGHSNDRLTLAFAQKLEMKFGGYVPPCEIIR
ncbi:fatty-acid amide hydrolase 2-like isoform X2 [Varroa jacobsoni]|uniref:fatty-acid amide hydrolase 2-like isoform X2 n=1 Tax=Varroa jacobsoni TaxID=62625 RepID=UPI000BFA8247|nr:fatty-acid amide hydrolase 2-like isoform X2 [Varroa jacobsoni]